MKIGGVSIVLILGIVNFILLLFQISSGLRWVRVPMTFHRKTGITLVYHGFHSWDPCHLYSMTIPHPLFLRLNEKESLKIATLEDFA